MRSIVLTVPERREMADRLAARMGATVVEDTKKLGSLSGYRLALLYGAGMAVERFLILEDDTIPAGTVDLDAIPDYDGITCLFSRDLLFASTHATIWNAELARSFCSWSEWYPHNSNVVMCLELWRRATGTKFQVASPSLFLHDISVPSARGTQPSLLVDAKEVSRDGAIHLHELVDYTTAVA